MRETEASLPAAANASAVPLELVFSECREL